MFVVGFTAIDTGLVPVATEVVAFVAPSITVTLFPQATYTLSVTMSTASGPGPDPTATVAVAFVAPSITVTPLPWLT